MEYKAIYETDDTLTHYGVLGMRWGHRKQRPSKGGIRNRLRKKYALNKDPKKERKEVEGNQYRTKLSLTGKPVNLSKEDYNKYLSGQYTQGIGNAEMIVGAGLLATGAVPLGAGIIAGGALGTAIGMAKSHSVKKKYSGDKKKK